MKIAILDDYQGVALQMADWSVLPGSLELEAYRDHLVGEDALVERLQGAAIIVGMRERTPFPGPLLDRLPRLRLLITTGGHNASFDLEAASRLGILVCGTGRAGEGPMELTWGLILSLARSIPQEDGRTRRGRWGTTVGVGLQGKTLGLLGLGHIGGRMAGVGRAFRMEVLAWSQNLTEERAGECGARRVDRDRLFRESDFLSIHLKLSQRTRALVGARELGLMKPEAFLINTSRGPIVEEEALIGVLGRGAIAGAGLDTFDLEPLPPEHPFLSLENTVIAPHQGYVTREAYRAFYGGAVEDIRAFLGGEPIRVLNPAVLESPRLRGHDGS